MKGIGLITQTEAQILALLAQHHTYVFISKSLHISMPTLYRHIANIMNKTGIHKKELLIKYAIEHGYGRQEALA
jgi:two-component system response regulator NreC